MISLLPMISLLTLPHHSPIYRATWLLSRFSGPGTFLPPSTSTPRTNSTPITTAVSASPQRIIPPLLRQQCRTSSLLVTSAFYRHFTRSRHFSSPPSTLPSPLSLSSISSHLMPTSIHFFHLLVSSSHQLSCNLTSSSTDTSTFTTTLLPLSTSFAPRHT
jgi:hypothetical protein